MHNNLQTNDFIHFSFKPEFLAKWGLPFIEYPILQTAFESAIEKQDHKLDFGNMLYWLQEYSALLDKGWEKLEPAILKLAELIAPEDVDQIAHIHTPDFYINAQKRDLSLELIGIHRGNQVLAIIRPVPEQKIGIMVFHALDAKAIRYLMNLARHPHPEHGVCMRENNWEYALDQAGLGGASMYASMRGESYLAYWENGLGVKHNGEIDSGLKHYHTKEQIMPNVVSAQIGNHYVKMPHRLDGK